MKFTLYKESGLCRKNGTIDHVSEVIGEYKEREVAFAVLNAFAVAFATTVQIDECGVGVGGDEEPCIWAHYVEDGNGAKYYICEDYVVGEDGVIGIDDFGFPIYTEEGQL